MFIAVGQKLNEIRNVKVPTINAGMLTETVSMSDTTAAIY
jgi:hypothetical protein